MSSSTVDFTRLTALAELYADMSRGRHIGRIHDSALWSNLEDNLDAYTTVFQGLGMELAIDPRGFAWLQNPRDNQAIAPRVRQIALLLLLLYEHQAAKGHSLEAFDRWLIDEPVLQEIRKGSRDLLETEGLGSLDDLSSVMKAAVRLGFARSESDGWQLLAAVRRFTDRFEELAQAGESPEEADIQADSRQQA